MEHIKICIVDDEKLIREGLKIILSAYPEIEVVGLCEDGEKAYELCKNTEVDVVLMDIRMPGCDGVQGTRLIKSNFTDIKVLILTTFNDDEYIIGAIRHGASGYLLKDTSYDTIVEAVKSVYRGNVIMHPEVANKIIENRDELSQQERIEEVKRKNRLTSREIDIIEGISCGLSNKEIGEKLFLTEGTVKNNITEILSKLELRDRTQIAIFAFKNKLVE